MAILSVLLSIVFHSAMVIGFCILYSVKHYNRNKHDILVTIQSHLSKGTEVVSNRNTISLTSFLISYSLNIFIDTIFCSIHWFFYSLKLSSLNFMISFILSVRIWIFVDNVRLLFSNIFCNIDNYLVYYSFPENYFALNISFLLHVFIP